MTAPLTTVRPGWVNLLPVDPEDQDAAAIIARHPRGAVVRLGEVDGVVLAHCVEQDAEGGDAVLAVIVHVADGCPDAGITRIWRTAQIVDSPLSEDHRAALSLEALSAPTPRVVQAILYGWSAETPGSVDPAPAAGEDAAPKAEAPAPADDEDAAEDPDAGDDAGPVETIPAAVLDDIDDVSLCDVRIAAASGEYGAHGYEHISRAFDDRRKNYVVEGCLIGAPEIKKLRGRLYHYVGMLVDHLDGVA